MKLPSHEKDLFAMRIAFTVCDAQLKQRFILRTNLEPFLYMQALQTDRKDLAQTALFFSTHSLEFELEHKDDTREDIFRSLLELSNRNHREWKKQHRAPLSKILLETLSEKIRIPDIIKQRMGYKKFVSMSEGLCTELEKDYFALTSIADESTSKDEHTKHSKS